MRSCLTKTLIAAHIFAHTFDQKYTPLHRSCLSHILVSSELLTPSVRPSMLTTCISNLLFQSLLKSQDCGCALSSLQQSGTKLTLPLTPCQSNSPPHAPHITFFCYSFMSAFPGLIATHMTSMLAPLHRNYHAHED